MVFFLFCYITLSSLVLVNNSFIINPSTSRIRSSRSISSIPLIAVPRTPTSSYFTSTIGSTRSNAAFLLLSRSISSISLPTNSSGSGSASSTNLAFLNNKDDAIDDTDVVSTSKIQMAYYTWLKQYNKSYDETRYSTFQQNFRLAEQYYWNNNNNNNMNDSDLELNEYADCTEEEYIALISASSTSLAVQEEEEEETITTTTSTTITTSATQEINGITSPSASLNPATKAAKYITIGRNIGSGSYGTVHLCTFVDADNDNYDNSKIMIAKRAWTEEELAAAAAAGSSTPGGTSTSNFPIVTTTESDSSVVTQLFLPNNNNNNKNNDLTAVVHFHSDTTTSSVTGSTNTNSDASTMNTMIKERSQLCQQYLEVERSCYEQMLSNSTTTRPVPSYLGTFLDDTNNYEWIVLSFIGRRYYHINDNNIIRLDTSDNQLLLQMQQQQQLYHHQQQLPAFTLADAIYRSSTTATTTNQIQEKKDTTNNHLAVIQRELGILTVEPSASSSFEYTLDTLFISLFSAIAYIHQHNIVHCDIKPANILLDPSTSSLVILDFGSSLRLNEDCKSRMHHDNMGRKEEELNSIIMAISPMYAAPEGTFVGSSENQSPYAFDVYSCGLIFCQLLFNLFDDLTTTNTSTPPFYQQLREANYDLDLWLSSKSLFSLSSSEKQNRLSSDLLVALTYLSHRPGLWNILKYTLKANPEQRYTAKEALQKFQDILKTKRSKSKNERKMMQDTDGAYFLSVISSLQLCEHKINNTEESGSARVALFSPRPLHFVATFDCRQPLGLTLTSSGGDVFVYGLVKGGQAENMGGRIEVGDRLVGIGEIPIYGGAFNKVINMLSNPRSDKTLSLHFDRPSLSKLKANFSSPLKEKANMAKVVDHGAWSSLGERDSQEDSFLLQELHEEAGNIILVAAVFDGHGGTTASETASQLFPGIFSTEVSVAMAEGNRKYKLSQILGDVTESTWKMTCNTYRNWYDTLTSTGSVYDLVPGTTAVAATFSMNDDDSTLHILNCGDSRALLIGRPQEKATTGTSFIHFSTKDHSPNCEIEAARLLKGVEAGLNYSLPENSLSRSWLTIGGYQYEVSRSLEGSYATSKGIVSTPDMFQIDLRQVLKEKGNVSLILASDGLFEWIGNEELSREVVQLRDAGYSAKDAARSIVGQALKKGTSDNISVVVIYFS